MSEAVLEIEDKLSEAECFVGGISGKPASMCAYMTVLDPQALIEILPSLIPEYSREVWDEAIAYWEYQAYLSPIPVMLAAFVKGHLETLLD